MSHSNHPTWGFEFFDTHATIGGLCCFAQLYKPAKPLGVTCEFVQRCSASRLSSESSMSSMSSLTRWKIAVDTFGPSLQEEDEDPLDACSKPPEAGSMPAFSS